MSCDIIFCDKTYATCKVIMFRSDLVCRPAEYKSLANFLKVKQLTLSTVTSDGFCLFRAVEVGLKQQNVPGICLKDIISKVRSEFADNLAYYSPFCLVNRNAANDLQMYLDYGQFDQGIADVSVAALCNSLSVRLVIYEVSKTGTLTETFHPPGRISPQSTVHTVRLLRSGGNDGRVSLSSEHYDVLLPCIATDSTTVKQRKARPGTIPDIRDMFRNHNRKKPKLLEEFPTAADDAESVQMDKNEREGENDLRPLSPVAPTPSHKQDCDNLTNPIPSSKSMYADDQEMTDIRGDATTDDSTVDDVDDIENSDQQQPSNATNFQAHHYPSVWTSMQAEDFQLKYPWLFFSNGCLGCKTCRSVQNLGPYKKQGSKISKEWSTAAVTFNCEGRKDQLSSLRKKI